MGDLLIQDAVVVVTGARGTGKSTLAATYAPPGLEDRVFWHDSERSANNLIRQMNKLNRSFGHYRNLPSRFSDLPSDKDLLWRIDRGELPWVGTRQKNALADYYEYVINDLNRNMEKDKYLVYVHDTIEALEAGMAAYVGANKKITGWSQGSHGRMWSEAVYPLYNHLIEALYGRGIKTIILTSHLKTPWENNQPVPGAVKPAGKKVLYSISSLMLWMVKGRAAPAGIVLKERLGKLSIGEDGEWEVKCMLPERIPVCTWREIKRYLRDGCDRENPEPGEVMTPDEKRMVSDLLTDRQMDLMMLTAQQNATRATATPVKVPEEVKKEVDEALGMARKMKEEGWADKEIKDKLADGYPIPTMVRVMEELGG